MPSSVSEVSMPKLSGSLGLSRRATRSATVASSMACVQHFGGRIGLTISVSDCRAPNSRM